ncbi:MAG: hypothetical protein SVQ76_02400 [Candidatus Nanohaloarchaea archaeon]|nr:hypothetical protein [Candidatus Nanohaloarchaea archaeon]
MVEAEGTVIETGVDRLLEYVRENGRTELQKAVEDLGTDKDTVVSWASALEAKDLIEVHYSARKGRILVPVEGEIEEEKVEEVREETSEELDRLEKIRSKETELEQFEEVLDRIRSSLEEDVEEAEDLEGRAESRKELEEVRDYIHDLESAEEGLDEFGERLDDIISGLKVLEQMEAKMSSEDGTESGESSKGFRGRLKEALMFWRGGEETFKCEECGKEFESRRGLETHRGMVHEDG